MLRLDFPFVGYSVNKAKGMTSEMDAEVQRNQF